MSSLPSPDPNDALASAIRHLNAGNYFQIAAFVMLIYDHILTLSDEVERIWKQKLTGASILFYINRYLTPLSFIVVIDAFQDPVWTKSACARFVGYEGAMTATLVAICDLLMILRVYALYGRSIVVLVFLLSLLVVQIILSAIGLSTGFAVPLPSGVTGCILTGTAQILTALWITPLITESCIFILTLWKTREYIRRSGRSPTLDIFLRDGALYFCVIFIANLLNTLIYFIAPDDLKAVGASFSQLMTSVMVSRLVLNLRSVSSTPNTKMQFGIGGGNVYIPRQHEDESFMTRTIGNLGEEFRSSHTHDTLP